MRRPWLAMMPCWLVAQQSYLDDDGHLDEVLGSLRETPGANRLLRAFIESVLLAPE